MAVLNFLGSLNCLFLIYNQKYYHADSLNNLLCIAVSDQMFLGMQDFDFAQINSNLAKSLPKFRFNFVQISPLFCPKLTKFAQI